jgi:threonine dehydrogenase-like Zn-dependent dehydrogenase
MKALVKTAPGPGNVAYQDWPDPELGPGDVLVAVKQAGLCGTDLSMYGWAENVMAKYRPPIPMVIGHECAGEVVEVGREVSGVRPGDQVLVRPFLTCGTCRYCLLGRPMLCVDARPMGFRANGVFAEYASLPASHLYPVENRLPWELAALAEPFVIAIHALERVPVEPGSTVAVIGPGSIGFCMLAALKLTPATRIVMVGTEADGERLAMAAEMGASTVNSEREDAAEAVRDLTGGYGADVVFETAGHSEAVTLAVRLAAKGARIGLIGLPHDVSRIDTAEIALAEKELIGIRAHRPRTWQGLAALLERASGDLARVVTHRLPMSEFERGFELMRSRQGLKVLISPDGGVN